MLARIAAGVHRCNNPRRTLAKFDLSAIAALWLGAGFEPIADPFGWPTASMVVFVVTFFCHNISPYFESGHPPFVLAILGPPGLAEPY
jgi:hypothetical protein